MHQLYWAVSPAKESGILKSHECFNCQVQCSWTLVQWPGEGIGACRLPGPAGQCGIWFTMT